MGEEVKKNDNSPIIIYKILQITKQNTTFVSEQRQRVSRIYYKQFKIYKL